MSKLYYPSRRDFLKKNVFTTFRMFSLQTLKRTIIAQLYSKNEKIHLTNSITFIRSKFHYEIELQMIKGSFMQSDRTWLDVVLTTRADTLPSKSSAHWVEFVSEHIQQTTEKHTVWLVYSACYGHMHTATHNIEESPRTIQHKNIEN